MPLSMFRALLTQTFALALLTIAQPGLAQDSKSGYRLGERLPSTATPAKAAPTYREIDWDALLPRDWDPAAALKGLDLANLRDGDPRAIEAMARMQEMFDNAPLNTALDNTRVRIPGFIVPLESRGKLIHEFLLVPYFGACIHTPPPPANQIIHVFPAKPLSNLVAMDPVWVSGAIETGRSKTSMGSAGYRLNADVVVPYKKR